MNLSERLAQRQARTEQQPQRPDPCPPAHLARVRPRCPAALRGTPTPSPA